jgi:hypothetical protein
VAEGSGGQLGQSEAVAATPCFELWLIIHHRHHTGPLTTDEAIRLRRQLDGSDGKHLDGALYLKLVDNAIRQVAKTNK